MIPVKKETKQPNGTPGLDNFSNVKSVMTEEVELEVNKTELDTPEPDAYRCSELRDDGKVYRLKLTNIDYSHDEDWGLFSKLYNTDTIIEAIEQAENLEELKEVFKND